MYILSHDNKWSSECSKCHQQLGVVTALCSVCGHSEFICGECMIEDSCIVCNRDKKIDICLS